MIHLKHLLKPAKLAALVAASSVFLSACGSSSRPINPPVSDDPVDDLVLIESTPIFDGNSIGSQRFVLEEDTPLLGKFYAEESPAAGLPIIRSLPAHGLLTLQADGDAFLYTAEENFYGSDGFTYLTFEEQRIDVTFIVNPVNDAPTLSADVPRVAEQGRLFEAFLEGNDVEGDQLRYSAANLPGWVQLDAPTGRLSGFPAQADVGFSSDVTFRVTDEHGLFSEVTGVSFEVIDVNDAPTLNLSQFPSELGARETVTAHLFPDDPEGGPVTLTVDQNMFIESRIEGGSITLTASDVNDVTNVNLVVQAADSQGSVVREVVPITLFPRTVSGEGITMQGSKQGRGVHLVLLGDGYASDQQNLFREHVDAAIAIFQTDAGIGDHIGAFNIHMISTVSVDSGADDNEQVDSRNTAFDSAYNCGGVLRLICANTLSMFETALMEYPAVDQIVLLVNDQRYGGSGNSGGSVAITSAFFPEIALHEMGHSLVDLADEYVDTLIQESSGLLDFQEGRYGNVTALTDPNLVPWAHWIDRTIPLPQNPNEEGVGLFEGGLYRQSNIYRPTFNSRMRTFDRPFGPVNSEQWILRLYELTEGIRGVSPEANSVRIAAGQSHDFSVSPIFGTDVQTIEWTVNGVLQTVSDANPARLTVSPPVGTHTVVVKVSDASGKIKLAPPHAGVYTRSWEILVE